MIKVLLVAGARPNFMKIAPILRAIENCSKDVIGVLVHTGQHYDRDMSDTFFTDLGIRKPDYNLGVGSSSHAEQTAKIMVAFEEVCLREKPDWVLVVGDVNSTIAAGLVAKKLRLKLAHVEAGLRSRDRDMPEEINRLATDAISDLFFTTEKEGTENLLREGHDPKTVNFVGHVMIDNLFFQRDKLNENDLSKSVVALKKRLPSRYICMTMHRPSNVDNKETLSALVSSIALLARDVPVIFPCHPRTRKNLEQFSLLPHFTTAGGEVTVLSSGIILVDPLGYNDFLYLWKDAALVLTDSGGLQEETTALKVPCITMRTSTERPITVDVGSNIIVGCDGNAIVEHGTRALAGEWKESRIPDLWDGNAAVRIIDCLRTYQG